MFVMFLDPVVICFMRQTLPTVNREHFFMNIICMESFCPQKSTTECCSSVAHSSSTIAILTTETSLWTYASHKTWCRHIARFYHPLQTKRNTKSKKHSCKNNACSRRGVTWQTDAVGLRKCDLGLLSHHLLPRQLQQ
jgi:hypothetical protein